MYFNRKIADRNNKKRHYAYKDVKNQKTKPVMSVISYLRYLRSRREAGGS
jgi:hypothetical protein